MEMLPYTGLLLLETAKAERLDSYAEHITGFVTQFGDESWSFICRTAGLCPSVWNGSDENYTPIQHIWMWKSVAMDLERMLCRGREGYRVWEQRLDYAHHAVPGAGQAGLGYGGG